MQEFYQNILSEKFIGKQLEEKKATCSRCPMLIAKKPFHSSTKCCTYYPFLPNYHVGGMLKENRRSDLVKDLIKQRKFIIPIGICPPPGYQAKFLNKDVDDFGRNPELLCPFFQTGSCSIWPFRGYQCATYFCKSSHGEAGEKHWQEVREYLHRVEMEISQSLMIQKGYTPKEIDRNLDLTVSPSSDSRNVMSALDWSQLWIHHQDDIEGYFVSCYEIVVQNSPEFKALVRPLRSTPAN